jgi:hypothetical protein
VVRVILLFVAGLALAGWIMADSAPRTAAVTGASTGGSAAVQTWRRRRGRTTAQRRDAWAGSGFLGWAAVQLERAAVSTGRFTYDGLASLASGLWHGAPAARTGWNDGKARRRFGPGQRRPDSAPTSTDSTPDSPAVHEPEPDSVPDSTPGQTNPFTPGQPELSTNPTEEKPVTTDTATKNGATHEDLTAVIAACDAMLAELDGGELAGHMETLSRFNESLDGVLAGVGGQLGQAADAATEGGITARDALSAVYDQIVYIRDTAKAMIGG